MTRKHRIPFADISRRITGISTPVFGVSWTPPKSKQDIVRRLVTFLEDRRALYAQYHMEYDPWVEKSVLEIRAELTDILKICPDDELLAGSMRAMRAACRKYLDETGHPGKRKHMIHPHGAEIWQALGKLRAVFGLHLARLCSAYGVDVEPELASIFPEYDIEGEV